MDDSILKHYPVFHKLARQHEARLQKFQRDAEGFFHPYVVKLCERIKKGIPQFEGCLLAMRHLYLEPRKLGISITDPEGETGDELLGNILLYLPERNNWKVNLPEDTKQALIELDTVANYIDDNYSMVAGMQARV